MTGQCQSQWFVEGLRITLKCILEEEIGALLRVLQRSSFVAFIGLFLN